MTDKKIWRQRMLLIMSDKNWELDGQKVEEVQYLAKLIQQLSIPVQSLTSLTVRDYENWLASGHSKTTIAKQHGVSLATLGRRVKELRDLPID